MPETIIHCNHAEIPPSTTIKLKNYTVLLCEYCADDLYNGLNDEQETIDLTVVELDTDDEELDDSEEPPDSIVEGVEDDGNADAETENAESR